MILVWPNGQLQRPVGEVVRRAAVVALVAVLDAKDVKKVVVNVSKLDPHADMLGLLRLQHIS